MSEPLLTVEGLAIAINGRTVVSDADFELRRGECLGLVGETGSGKSVTCRAIVGLLDRIGGHATAGSLNFDGIDLRALGERGWRALRGRRIGFIPQSSLSGLDPVMTIGRQLMETLSVLRGDGDERQQAVELLERVQMPRVHQQLDAYPHELSGGMKQRVMIALAIAGQPDVLVADEPTTALDVTVQREILDLLTELRIQSKMALVLVTHDLGVVSAVSNHVAVMYAGATVERGATGDVIEHPVHPYTQALVAARPSLIAAGTRLNAVPGHPPDPHDWPDGCRFAPRCPVAIDECRAAFPSIRTLAPDRRIRCVRVGDAPVVAELLT